jgi:beta-lactamase regulating signal transducer with metallopeptidase domain
LAELLLATLISSAALIVIAALRLPLRHAFGARAAYWVWLLAPASIMGLFVPRPHRATSPATQTLSAAASHAWHALPAVAVAAHHISIQAAAGLLVWLTGVAIALCVNVLRQYRLVGALAPLCKSPDGTLRSGAIVMPLVVGAWSPRVIVPIDFERRYGESGRKLMMAHEAAHIARSDTRVAALAAGWACIFWFNPLVYWAISRLRFDQELACDAEILAQFNGCGRDYAAALFDAQLATQISVASPIACHWHSAHPLKKRITMLTKKLPGTTRARLGIAVAIAVSALGSAVVWAAQPHDITEGSRVALNMIWFADHDPRFPAHIIRVSVDNRLVQNGETLKSMSSDDGVTCTPHATHPRSDHRRSSIRLRCKFRADGRIFAEREFTVHAGRLAALDMKDPQTGTRLYVVLSASTLPEPPDQAQMK